MKLTAKKLKQLIREELQEAHMRSLGPKGGPRDPEITEPLDPDIYMRISDAISGPLSKKIIKKAFLISDT